VKIRPLVMDEAAQAEIKRVRDYAENHPFSVSRMKLLQEGEIDPPGDDPNYVANIQFGYRCVFTLDQAPLKVDKHATTWLRHLSISVNELDKCPHMVAVNMLMKEFGYRQEICDMSGNPKNAKLAIWIENENDPTMPKAINVVEEYEEI